MSFLSLKLDLPEGWRRLQPGNGVDANMKLHVVLLGLALVLTGCMSASQHRQEVRDDTGDKLTVGTVQREVRVGMSGGEVAEVLGAPNIVSTDEQRREVWIYDKISTEYVSSGSSGGISTLILGGAGSVGAGVGGSVGRNAGAASTSQRTLTVIIKFGEQGLVRDFAYRTSNF